MKEELLKHLEAVSNADATVGVELDAGITEGAAAAGKVAHLKQVMAQQLLYQESKFFCTSKAIKVSI